MENFPCVSFDTISEYDFLWWEEKLIFIKDNIKNREHYSLEGCI